LSPPPSVREKRKWGGAMIRVKKRVKSWLRHYGENFFLWGEPNFPPEGGIFGPPGREFSPPFLKSQILNGFLQPGLKPLGLPLAPGNFPRLFRLGN